MTKWLLVLASAISLKSFAQTRSAGMPPAATSLSPNNAAPLDLIISQVKAALDLYQQSAGNSPDALPPLTSAEFDFKTCTAAVEGFTINLLIFKIGGSHEKDVVNDVTFTYQVPGHSVGSLSMTKPPTLTEQLANTIQSAAASVKTCKEIGKLRFKQFTVNLQYSVKWEGNIGASVPISLVTLGPNADVNKNEVQSVKLVFGD
jgi:hypothetical protein